MAALQLRPMGIGDILDTTFRLYRANFLTFLLISSVAYVPFSAAMSVYQTILTGFQQRVGQMQPVPRAELPSRSIGPASDRVSIVPAQAGAGNQVPFEGPPFGPADLVRLFVSLGFMLLFALLLLPWCQGALVHNISSVYLGGKLGAWESYKLAGPRIFRLIRAAFLGAMAGMFGMCLCIVPGIIFFLWFSLVSPVVMLENKGVFATLGRSRELMRGNLGKAFMLGLVVGLLSGVVNVALSAGTSLLPWPHPFLEFFVANVIGAAFVPFQLAPTVLLYYDLRIRKEAFDLQMLSSELGRPAVAA